MILWYWNSPWHVTFSLGRLGWWLVFRGRLMIHPCLHKNRFCDGKTKNRQNLCTSLRPGAPQSSHGPEHPICLQVLDAKGNLTALKTYWITLPSSLCSKRVMASSASDDKCWNGMTKGRYGVGHGASTAPAWGERKGLKRHLHIIAASPTCSE